MTLIAHLIFPCLVMEFIKKKNGKPPFAPSTGRSELDQAVYEAKHHQYAGEYNSLEEFRKDLYSPDED